MLQAATMGPAHSAEAPAAKPGEGEPAVMIVLDGSGSMWGKIGKEQKINAARDALKAVLPKLQSASVGLTSFGHRRTADCSDVEVALQPAKGAQERLLALLDKLNPKGKGPVGSAVKAAAQSLAENTPEGSRRSLIVMADNADNCKVDTCELAQELGQDHPGLVVHVIGLGLPKDEVQALSCLASTTGGRFFKAEQVQEIGTALEQAVKLAAGPPATAVPPAAVVATPAILTPPPPPTGPPGLRLSAALASGGAEIVTGVRWRVTAEPGTGNTPGTGNAADKRVLYEGEDSSPDLDLPPGRYRIATTFGFASAEYLATVGAAGRTKVQVPLEAGIITVKDSSTRNGPATDRVFYTLYAVAVGAGKEKRALSLSSDTPPVYNVPAGTYVIAVQQGLARIERSVVIAAGTVADVDLPLYLGELSLSATATEGAQPLDRIMFQVFEDDPDAAGGLKELIRSSAANPQFSLPAGSYLVVARHEAAEVRERVSVKPGTRLTKALVLASGRLTVASRLPARLQARLDPDQISYRILRQATERPARPEQAAIPGESALAEVTRVHAPERSLALTAGRYRVECRYGSINVRAQRDVEIKPGATQVITFEMDAGIVVLKAAVRPAGGALLPETANVVSAVQPGVAAAAPVATAVLPAAPDVYWEILDASGQLVWSTSQGAPRLPLASGRYIARAESRKTKGEQAFAIASGDDKTVEIELK